jgi:radical SAM-linked protein
MTRIRFRYAVGEPLKFLSHLDLMRLFHRAMRRSGLPMAYTQGFNPHPKLNLAAPLPVGVTASGEYGDLFLTEPLSPGDFLQALAAQLPAGLSLTGAMAVDPAAPSLAAVIDTALYYATWSGPSPGPPAGDIQRALQQLLLREEIRVKRQSKGGKTVQADVRPYIYEASPHQSEDGSAGLALLLQLGSKGGVSPFVVLQQLSLHTDFLEGTLWRLHRQGIYIYHSGRLTIPFWKGGEEENG